MKQKIMKRLAVFALAFGMVVSMALPAVQADAKVIEEYYDTPEKIEKPDQEGAVPTVLLRTGREAELTLENADGKIKWFVNNERLLKIISKGSGKCTVKGLHSGKVTVMAVAQNQVTKYNIIITSGDLYVNLWCKQWVADSAVKNKIPKIKLPFPNIILLAI